MALSSKTYNLLCTSERLSTLRSDSELKAFPVVKEETLSSLKAHVYFEIALMLSLQTQTAASEEFVP